MEATCLFLPFVPHTPQSHFWLEKSLYLYSVCVVLNIWTTRRVLVTFLLIMNHPKAKLMCCISGRTVMAFKFTWSWCRFPFSWYLLHLSCLKKTQMCFFFSLNFFLFAVVLNQNTMFSCFPPDSHVELLPRSCRRVAAALLGSELVNMEKSTCYLGTSLLFW